VTPVSEPKFVGFIHEGTAGDHGYGPHRVHRLVALPAGSKVLLGDGRLHTTTQDGIWPEFVVPRLRPSAAYKVELRAETVEESVRYVRWTAYLGNTLVASGNTGAQALDAIAEALLAAANTTPAEPKP
jgi:hypothetical protein